MSIDRHFRQENGKQRFGDLGTLIHGRLRADLRSPLQAAGPTAPGLTAMGGLAGRHQLPRWWVSLPEPPIPLGLLPTAVVVGDSAWLCSVICRRGPWFPWAGDPGP